MPSFYKAFLLTSVLFYFTANVHAQTHRKFLQRRKFWSKR